MLAPRPRGRSRHQPRTPRPIPGSTIRSPIREFKADPCKRSGDTRRAPTAAILPATVETCARLLKSHSWAPFALPGNPMEGVRGPPKNRRPDFRPLHFPQSGPSRRSPARPTGRTPPTAARSRRTARPPCPPEGGERVVGAISAGRPSDRLPRPFLQQEISPIPGMPASAPRHPHRAVIAAALALPRWRGCLSGPVPGMPGNGLPRSACA